MCSDESEANPIGTDGISLFWVDCSCFELMYARFLRQDVYAILLDNYLLLTREEEGGKYVVISRVSLL